MPVTAAWNMNYVESLYELWREDANRVTAEWRAFFEGFELGASGGGTGGDTWQAAALQAKVEALIHRYRDLGHLAACVDPLSACPSSHPLLDPTAVGLAASDLGRTALAFAFFPSGRARTEEVLDALRTTYCGAVGAETLHLPDPLEREWLRARMEPVRNRAPLDRPGRLRALELLTRAGRFEEFLQRRYPGQTRFSLEGAEGALLAVDETLRCGAGQGIREVVLAMAHRGRLNVQVTLLGKTLEDALCEFEASYDPDAVPGGGDVKYHSGYLAELAGYGPAPLRVLLPENPSHLEAVYPVAEGVTRARQERWGAEGPSRVLPLVIHGDASVAGQGIVAETLNLSRLAGYSTGGTVHLVLNNQIGYTTQAEHSRSTRYATDIAKMLGAPVFHVQGEDPGALVHAARLACGYRAEFGKDVFIDVLGYRRHGHNEGDEPYFTQPLLYRAIRERPPPYEVYARRLVAEGTLTDEEVRREREEIDGKLDAAHASARSKACAWRLPEVWEGWEGVRSRYSHDPVETGVPEARLRDLLERLCRVPEGFAPHPTLRRVIDRRLESARTSGGVDWSGAEALAFGSLLAEGTPVRLSGEDSCRGTFSQRHAVWFDSATGAAHCPLAHASGDQAPFVAIDSPLSEEAVLGFEYGYSAAEPRTLVLWEAQYGDFANEAQVILDQFVASGEAKWQRRCGLAVLLPHGYEGQGPDHSTGRIERFLELCADYNLEVCVPSTPSQYFHLLRRQVRRPFRKPLVVFTPKSLLRHPAAVSPLAELSTGYFRQILFEPRPDRVAPRRVACCAGKVYYELAARREELGARDVALVRAEQLYPFPAEAWKAVERALGAPPEWVWVQEEPRNMGAWGFLKGRIEEAVGQSLRYVGRPEAASPATGFSFIHKREQVTLLDEALT